MKSEINQNIFEQIFIDHAVKAQVFLRSTKTKGSNFDKFRNVGYDIEKQNPIFVKMLTKAILPNSLIVRELGLTETGALQGIIKQNDLSAIKLCEKIIIENEEYTPWNQALGNRIQVFKLPYNYSKIIIFRFKK